MPGTPVTEPTEVPALPRRHAGPLDPGRGAAGGLRRRRRGGPGGALRRAALCRGRGRRAEVRQRQRKDGRAEVCTRRSPQEPSRRPRHRLGEAGRPRCRNRRAGISSHPPEPRNRLLARCVTLTGRGGGVRPPPSRGPPCEAPSSSQVRTPPFQGGNTGSNPVGATTLSSSLARRSPERVGECCTPPVQRPRPSGCRPPPVLLPPQTARGPRISPPALPGWSCRGRSATRRRRHGAAPRRRVDGPPRSRRPRAA